MTVEERFLRYIAMDTQSDENSGTYPSTEKQKALLRLLREELEALGLADAAMDEYGYVTATLPARGAKASAPVLGLLAHVDTSPDCSGADVRPRTLLYEGGDIVLNAEAGVVMRTQEFPELACYKGKHLIVTDGTTLLGADDKAGVAEIMQLLQMLREDPELSHPTLRIAFTPDEEVGRGTEHFDVPAFGADFAYTVDGGALGELEYENFNAAGAQITVHGRNIHPGSAKGKMRNACLIAAEFTQLPPCGQRPELTENYEGFFHLTDMRGDVEQAQLHYIVRDHDRASFERKKELLHKSAAFLNEKYGEGTVSLTVTDSYYNMKEKLLPHMHLIENARAAMAGNGVEARIRPIRGGTDGARLSFCGLPCPNLCTGGMNFHGRYEYICIEDMRAVTNILCSLVQKYADFS